MESIAEPPTRKEHFVAKEDFRHTATRNEDSSRVDRTGGTPEF
ncbi:hypothetical protein DSOL_1921 [Desulfosporosinus metallidurans]|uniref:Uncharacterized protein n=1 Tax=Desulfosporosinus metallidurans TaxID=1888891 RepID=A0A1Q8QYD9_9FIRM|nr:hypothetical protein DSOL_1921 [Desulfosporosinus metallidurans]